jgi:hypothetical protein
MGKYFLQQSRIMRAIMENNFEYRIFHEELRRLHKEYQRCIDIRIKKEISKDIELLKNAIKTI